MAFSSRSLVLVTGASRGFGKEVAQELVRQIASKQPVDVVLLARSRGGLQSTAEAIKMMQLEHKVVVQPESLDLSDLSTLEQNVGKIFAEIGQSAMCSFLVCFQLRERTTCAHQLYIKLCFLLLYLTLQIMMCKNGTKLPTGQSGEETCARSLLWGLLCAL